MQQPHVSCTFLCSMHCSGAGPEPLLGPIPELLSNSSPPSDSQIDAIRDVIERAKKNLVYLRGEILSEIFIRCVDPHVPLDPLRNGHWVISQVCRRWRVVALAFPAMWRHFVLPSSNMFPHRYLVRILSIQLERARRAPLSIHFREHLDVMHAFFAVSTEWERIVFSNPTDFSGFLKHGGIYSALRRLEVRSWHPILADAETDMVESLPALRDLVLDLHYEAFPRQILLPWSQLRGCTFHNVPTEDVLWMLSLVSPHTHVSISGGLDHHEVTQTKSPIRSLEMNDCSWLFFRDILRSLVAPDLQKLVIGQYGSNGKDDIAQEFLSFLKNSGCLLKHLRFSEANLCLDFVIQILESPHAHELDRLDVKINLFRFNDTFRFLEAFATMRFLPQLRTLVIRGGNHLHLMDLSSTLASRKPVVRTLPFNPSQWDIQVQSSLDTDKLDVVLLQEW
ncbi:hypothetical protein B0H11DRAFT_1372518 [Mycena galericulata]|nr:hypothetical protein B0H11DRAFT_1372518 [Mycena galericulata]